MILEWLPAVVAWFIVALIFLTICLAGRWQQKSFNERFPPISDDEFMARCPPDTNREIALKVRQIVAEQCAIEYGRIYPESSFMNDLNV